MGAQSAHGSILSNSLVGVLGDNGTLEIIGNDSVLDQSQQAAPPAPQGQNAVQPEVPPAPQQDQSPPSASVSAPGAVSSPSPDESQGQAAQANGTNGTQSQQSSEISNPAQGASTDETNQSAIRPENQTATPQENGTISPAQNSSENGTSGVESGQNVSANETAIQQENGTLNESSPSGLNENTNASANETNGTSGGEGGQNLSSNETAPQPENQTASPANETAGQAQNLTANETEIPAANQTLNLTIQQNLTSNQTASQSSAQNMPWLQFPAGAIISPDNLTLQFPANVGSPVMWIQKASSDFPANITVRLPAGAYNIEVEKMLGDGPVEISQYWFAIRNITASSQSGSQGSLGTAIGEVEGNASQALGVLSKAGRLDRLGKLFYNVTGGANLSQLPGAGYLQPLPVIAQELAITGNEGDFEISYLTPAPVSHESQISKTSKIIRLYSSEYCQNITASAYLPSEVSSIGEISLGRIIDASEPNLSSDEISSIRQSGMAWRASNFSASDTDGDGKLDYVEWSVPELSNQTYALAVKPAAAKMTVVATKIGSKIVSFAPGKQVEISNDALNLLQKNTSVRLIVKSGNRVVSLPRKAGAGKGGNAAAQQAGGTSQQTGSAAQQAGSSGQQASASPDSAQNLSELYIPSIGLDVVNVTADSLAGLSDSGATQIFVDTPMQMSGADFTSLTRTDLAQSAFGLSGQGVSVCLLDTGVNASDPYFDGKVMPGFDFINNDSDASDDNGHGTFMASVIHAMAPNASIIPIKVLDASGQGYSSDIIAGIDYCESLAANDSSIRVVSMSLGGGNYASYCDDEPVAQAVNGAAASGLFAVASAGNNGADYVTAPACASNATAVSSTSESDTVSPFSNMRYGLIGLLAPGEGITSEGLGGQETRSGTSVSAAHASGAAALLFESNSSLSPSQAKLRLISTGITIAYGGNNYSRLDTYNAVSGNLSFGIPEPYNGSGNATNGTGGTNYTAQAFACSSGTLSTTCYVTATVTPAAGEKINGTGNLVVNSTGAILLASGTFSINMTGNVTVVSGGSISTKGANGAGGGANPGAAGGALTIYASNLWNSGTISCQGGNGAAGTYTAGAAGGAGGNLSLIISNYLENNGTATTQGGSGAAGTAYGAGGAGASGGSVSMNTSTGAVSGNISSAGGAGGGSTIGGGAGGKGYTIAINASGSFNVSGTVTSQGGIAGTGGASGKGGLGGSGGNITITLANGTMTGNFTSAGGKGGDSSLGGIDAGNGSLLNISTANFNSVLSFSAASVINSSGATGGSATTGSGATGKGGAAGPIYLSAGNLTISGPMYATGGNNGVCGGTPYCGLTIAGNGGNASLISENLTLGGTVNLAGGNGHPGSGGYSNGGGGNGGNLSSISYSSNYSGSTINTTGGINGTCSLGCSGTMGANGTSSFYVGTPYSAPSSSAPAASAYGRTLVVHVANRTGSPVQSASLAINVTGGSQSYSGSLDTAGININNYANSSNYTIIISGMVASQNSSIPSSLYFYNISKTCAANASCTSNASDFMFCNATTSCVASSTCYVQGSNISTDTCSNGTWQSASAAVACANLTTANSNTTLVANLSINSSTCFSVTAANVTINCAGYSITGNNTTNAYGIYSNQSNTIVKNCVLASWQSGIYLNTSAGNATVANTTVSDGRGANGTTTSLATCPGNPVYGIYSLAQNGTFQNLTFARLNGGGAVSYRGSTGGLGGLAYAIYLSASFNTLSNISMSNISAGVGGGGSSPAAGGSACAIYMPSASNNTLVNLSISNITAGTGGAGVGGYGATGGAAYAIFLNSSSNDSIGLSSIALVTSGAGGSGDAGNGANGNASGIYLLSSSSNILANITANVSNGTVVKLDSSSSNKLYNNTLISNSQILLQLASSSGANTFYWNNFTNTSGYYVNDTNGSNYYNTTISGHGEGNVWYNVLNGSVAITGASLSTGYPSLYYGTGGSGYPYNNSTSGGKLSGAVVDNAPLTNSSSAATTGNLTVNYTSGGTATGNNSTFTPPANLTINATASAGYGFVNWTVTTGNCTVNSTTSANTQIQVNNSSWCNVQANFAQYGNLTVNATAGGTATGNNSTFVPPANLTINATASAGYSFSNWSVTTGNCTVNSTTSANTQIQVNNSSWCNVQANFANICRTLSTAGATETLTQNLAINGSTCYTVSAANVTINCNGYSITGNNTTGTYGIYSTQFNTTIKNCNISNFATGIYFHGGQATNGTITNDTASTTFGVTGSNGYATYLDGAGNYNTISNSNFTATGGYGLRIDTTPNTVNNISASSDILGGLYLTAGSQTIANSTFSSSTGRAARIDTSANNLIYNNTFIIPNPAIAEVTLAATSGNNTFYWNNFTNSSGYYVQDLNGSNYYNTTVSGHGEGNVWYNVLNGSVQVLGITNSTGYPSLYYGTGGSGYPYNNSTAGGKLSGAVVDNAPLTATATTGNLTVNYTSGGTATGNNSTFTPPANLTINATASANYYFVNWTVTTGNCTVNSTTSANTQIQVNNSSWCNVQASFVQYGNLTVNYTSGGTATGNNSTFTPPANLTINATASAGYSFSNWSVTTGNCTVNSTTSANTQIQVNNSSWCNVQANFAQSGNLTVNATAGGTATGNNSSFAPPANLTINATAGANYYFVNWTVTTGNCSVNNSSSANTQVQVNNASRCNVQANFATICQTFSTSNTAFTMPANASINGSTCFTVSAENVSINCAGYSITGDNTGGTYAIYATNFNATVKNCVVANFSNGVFVFNAANATIINTSASSTSGGGIVISTGSYFNIANSTGSTTDLYNSGIYVYSSSYGSITNSAGNSGAYPGIYLLSNANNNTISGSNGTASSGAGIEIDTNCNYNTISNSVGFSNSSPGVDIYSSSGNTIANSTIRSNTSTAFYFDTSANSNTAYNDTIISGNGATALIYLASTAGANAFYWNNFTNTSGLYVNDSNGSNYYNTTISGHGEGNVWYNVLNGSVNITGTNASTGYPSLYYGTNGTGYPYNNSTAGGKLSGIVVDYAPLTNTTPPSVSCANLSTANSATTLTANLAINGSTCFSVTAANVTINCAGYSITGNNTTNAYGIYSNQSSTTVKNCILASWQTGIYLNTSAGNATVANTTVSDGRGVTGATSTAGNPVYGIYSAAQNGTFQNLTFARLTAGNGGSKNAGGSAYALYLSSASNTVSNISISSIAGAVGGVGGLSNGGAGGSAYAVYISSNLNTLSNISSSNITSGAGGGGGGGGNGGSAYAIYLSSAANNTLSNLPASNITAGTGGAGTLGSGGSGGSAYALYLGSSSNNSIGSLSASLITPGGIDSSGGSGVNGANGNASAIYLLSSSSNILANTTANLSNGTVVRLDSSSSNTLYNNTLISGSQILLQLASSSGANTIYWNNFTNTSALYVNDTNGSNFYNTTFGGPCYQESANVSTACGGLSTGAYLNNFADANWYDGNWSTASTAISGSYVNYTVPAQAQSSSLWQVKDTYGTANLSLGNCWNAATLQFQITVMNGDMKWQCWNGSTWHTMRTATQDQTTYEEAMWWSFSSHPEGNVWYNVLNGSVNITGTNASTGYPSLYYGTAGSGYPYNNSTAGGKLSGAVVDNAPLTATSTATTGNLTVNYTSGGTATGNNSTFTPPANLTINATASANYYFVNWTVTTGNCTLNNSTSANTAIQVNDTSLCNVQANFANICRTLSTAGATETLTQNISISGSDCFDVNAENVTINCAGYSITGDNTGNYGIYAHMFNTTIKNCVISMFWRGVQASGASNITITNTSVTGNYSSTYGYGVAIATGSNYFNISSSTFTSSSKYACGIYVDSSSYGTITNSAGTANDSHGIYFSGNSNITVTNSTGTSNSGVGISLSGTSNITISGSTGASNLSYGIDIGGNNDTIANSTISSNNSTVFHFSSGSSSNTAYNNTLVSGKGAGVLLYLSTNDGNNTFYWNNFTNTSGYYVNDSNGSNYYNTTISGHGEGNVWYNVLNGSVQVLGGATSTGYPSLYYGTAGLGYPYNNSTSGGKLLGNVSDSAPLTSNSSVCRTLSTAGYTETLQASTSINGSTCYTVSAANVTINCNGYSITGNNTTGTYGIYSNQFNTTVMNCNISNFANGINFAAGSNNGTITNNNVSTTSSAGRAIYVAGSSYLTIANNNASSSGAAWSGYVYNLVNTNYSLVANNTATSATTVGFYNQNTPSIYNTYLNDTALGNYMGFVSDTNTGGSNYTNNTVNMPSSSQCFYFTASSNNIVTNANITCGAYGIKDSSGSNGNTFTGNTISEAGAGAATHGIYIDGGSNVSIDCQGKSITGNNTTGTYGIYSTQFNTTVKNCNISNFATGIYFHSATNGTITNDTASTTFAVTGSNGYAAYLDGGGNYNTVSSSNFAAIGGYGLRMDSTPNTVNNISASSDVLGGLFLTAGSQTIANSTFTSTTGRAARIDTSSNNQFINNTFIIPNPAIAEVTLAATSGNNTFYWNNFTNSSGYYVQDLNGSNYYNTTVSGHGEGNVWYNVLNGSVQVLGITNSTGYPSLYYGTGGSGYPYNNSTAGGKLSGAVVDNAPLTNATLSCGTLSTANSATTLLANLSANGSSCFNVTAANVTINCAGFSIASNNTTGTYGIYTNQNGTIIENCSISGFYYGAYLYGSANATLLSNNISGNANIGVELNATTNANLTSNTVCSNTRDIDATSSAGNGTLDKCDSFANWTESSHAGCVFACTSLWHEVFGNLSAALVLQPTNASPYVYRWVPSNTMNMYFTDYDSSVQWQYLQAIGRNSTGGASSNDFVKIDSALNSSSFRDNITSTFSSDGTTPLQTDNYTIYNRFIANVPLANSTATTTAFKTGILWDTSAGGSAYDNATKQPLVFVVRADSSPVADAYGTYQYLSRLPYTLGTYTGSNNLVAVYYEIGAPTCTTQGGSCPIGNECCSGLSCVSTVCTAS